MKKEVFKSIEKIRDHLVNNAGIMGSAFRKKSWQIYIDYIILCILWVYIKINSKYVNKLNAKTTTNNYASKQSCKSYHTGEWKNLFGNNFRFT